jgi:Transglycosylase-like domain
MRKPGRFFRRIGVLACALSLLAGDVAASPADRGDPLLQQIREYRAETWRWQRLMGVPLTPSHRRAERSPSSSFREWALAHWQSEAATARRRAKSPPRLTAWMCIHRHEGPWNANTGNGYYGGLQMDMAFQRAHGADLLRAKGPAHRWTPIEQIWVAERAYRSGLGFRPWPNTARYCGLL